MVVGMSFRGAAVGFLFSAAVGLSPVGAFAGEEGWPPPLNPPSSNEPWPPPLNENGDIAPWPPPLTEPSTETPPPAEPKREGKDCEASVTSAARGGAH